MRSLPFSKLLFLLTLTFPLKGCVSMSDKYRDITVSKVDIDRFMGKWYVIASIPTWFEKNASNAVETYTKTKKNKIHVSFTYHKETPSGPKKEMTQTAYVVDQETNAHWKIRPLWPFLFDYLIIDLDEENYSYTTIGRPGRQNLWIMARTPKISEELYQRLIQKSVTAGYDETKIQKVPQEW